MAFETCGACYLEIAKSIPLTLRNRRVQCWPAPRHRRGLVGINGRKRVRHIRRVAGALAARCERCCLPHDLPAPGTNCRAGRELHRQRGTTLHKQLESAAPRHAPTERALVTVITPRTPSRLPARQRIGRLRRRRLRRNRTVRLSNRNALSIRKPYGTVRPPHSTTI